MIYEYECPRCGKVYEKINSVANRYEAFCCGRRSIKLITKRLHIPDDQMYNFVAGYLGDQPKQIYGKTQYKKELKKNGLADATISECLSVKPKKDCSSWKSKRMESVKRISRKLGERGLLNKVGKAMEQRVFKPKGG